MHKFDWFEQRGIDGTPLVKSLSVNLRNELPSILPETRVINSAIMDDLLSGPGRKAHVFEGIRTCVACTNAREHSLAKNLVRSALSPRLSNQSR